MGAWENPRWHVTITNRDTPDALHEITEGGTGRHIAYVRHAETADLIQQEHNRALERQEEREKTAPEHRAGGTRERFAARWRAQGHNIETGDGVRVVATCYSQAIAEHVAELHNRTFGDGQDPPMPRAALPYPENEQALHQKWLAEPTSQVAGPDRQDGQHEILTVGDKSNLHVGYIQSGRIARYLVTLHNDRQMRMRLNPDREKMAADVKGSGRVDALDALDYAMHYRERHSGPLPPSLRARVAQSALGQSLRHAGAPDYVARMADLVETEVQRRINDYAAREPARISIAENPDFMARALLFACGKPGVDHRHATYEAAMRCHRVPTKPVLELAHRDGGTSLLVDGVSVAHATEHETGGYGICWAARGLARVLGLQLIDFGKEMT